MAKHVVGRLADWPPGSQRLVRIVGRDIAIFNVQGTFHALRNNCPHQGGPLHAGQVVGRIESSRPGEYNYRWDKKMIKCPWHGWEFDLETGQSWFDPAHKRVRAYPVTVEPGAAVVARDDGPPGLKRGPFVAETLPISVEDEYIIVEVDN